MVFTFFVKKYFSRIHGVHFCGLLGHYQISSASQQRELQCQDFFCNRQNFSRECHLLTVILLTQYNRETATLSRIYLLYLKIAGWITNVNFCMLAAVEWMFVRFRFNQSLPLQRGETNLKIHFGNQQTAQSLLMHSHIYIFTYALTHPCSYFMKSPWDHRCFK